MRNFEPVGVERRKYADLRDAHAPLWRIERAQADFWQGEDRLSKGSDGITYRLLDSAVVNDLGNAAALPGTGNHGDVILNNGDALRYWWDGRGYVAGVVNPAVDTWVSFGDGNIGTVPPNPEIDPVTAGQGSWLDIYSEFVRWRPGTFQEMIDSVGYNRWLTTDDPYAGTWWNDEAGNWVPESISSPSVVQSFEHFYESSGTTNAEKLDSANDIVNPEVASLITDGLLVVGDLVQFDSPLEKSLYVDGEPMATSTWRITTGAGTGLLSDGQIAIDATMHWQLEVDDDKIAASMFFVRDDLSVLSQDRFQAMADYCVKRRDGNTIPWHRRVVANLDIRG